VLTAAVPHGNQGADAVGLAWSPERARDVVEVEELFQDAVG
jgi:hypothetical protein